MIEKATTFFTKPMLQSSFDEIYVGDKLVLVVDILMSDIKHQYAISDDQKWRVYIKVKDKNVLASKVLVDVFKKNTKVKEF
jgi:hypothetical protein